MKLEILTAGESRARGGPRGHPTLKQFLVMRTIAKRNEVDWKGLVDSIDEGPEELMRVLDEMRTRKEVEVVADPLRGRAVWFRLTPSGKDEYVRALGSMYEFPE